MVLIIPCFNEERRLRMSEFVDHCNLFELIVFVDDGSTDKTAGLLVELGNEIEKACGAAHISSLAVNSGKGEAVRHGVLEALRRTNQISGVAIADADLSTPLSEMARLAQVASQLNVDVLQGSRVQLMGRDIQRSGFRHYIGRLAATLISQFLEIQVYDTQAGAKVFSRKAAETVFTDKFTSRWLFDCEIFLRATRAALTVYEEPLMVWKEQKIGSKVTIGTYLRSLIDLLRIRRAYFG